MLRLMATFMAAILLSAFALGCQIRGDLTGDLDTALKGGCANKDALLSVHALRLNPVRSKSTLTIGSADAENLSRTMYEVASAELDLAIAKQGEEADAVFEIQLNEFQEVEGSAVGAFNGAKVDLVANLSSNRGLICRYTFHFSDIALTDNLLSVNEREHMADGVSWLNRQEVFKMALKAVYRELSTQRLALFKR